MTSGNAGHRIQSSLVGVGVGSRTLTWLPLSVMEPGSRHRGLSDRAVGCGILLGVHDQRLLLHALGQSRPLQPFTSIIVHAERKPALYVLLEHYAVMIGVPSASTRQ